MKLKHWVVSFLIETEDEEIWCGCVSVDEKDIVDAAKVADYMIRNKYNVKRLLIHDIGICDDGEHYEPGSFGMDPTMEPEDFADIEW
jgi:hypothetical protein